MLGHLLDSQLCTSKIQLGGEFFGGCSTYAQQRHPFAYPDLSPMCRVQLAVHVLHKIQWRYCNFSIFLGQEKNLLLLILSHSFVQLGEMQDLVLSCTRSSETQMYLIEKHLIMAL